MAQRPLEQNFKANYYDAIRELPRHDLDLLTRLWDPEGGAMTSETRLSKHHLLSRAGPFSIEKTKHRLNLFLLPSYPWYVLLFEDLPVIA